MSNQRYTPEFKDEAVRQIIERDYSVSKGITGRYPFSHPAVYFTGPKA